MVTGARVRGRPTTVGLVAFVAVVLVTGACQNVTLDGSTPGEDAVMSGGGGKGPDLEFLISLPKMKFGKGQPVSLKMTLRNMGNQEVTVNKRFLVNDKAAPPEFREVTLAITMPDGKKAEFAWDLRVGFPEPKDFRKLKPGGQVSGKADIADLFSLTKKGTYSVKATYKNVHRGPTVFDAALQGFVVEDRKAARVRELSNLIVFHIGVSTIK